MRDTTAILDSCVPAMLERLNDQKNKAKGEFPKELLEIKRLLNIEVAEGNQEFDNYADFIIDGKPFSWDNLRHELADIMVYCAFGIKVCDENRKS